MPDLAADTRSVLAASYPESLQQLARAENRPWYKFW
jgi:hypothetical protein